MIRLQTAQDDPAPIRLKSSILTTNHRSKALGQSVGAQRVGTSIHRRILGLQFRVIRLNDAGKALSEVKW